jgi:tRNA A-37 threonylcarbamoyl transferase component Bud32
MSVMIPLKNTKRACVRRHQNGHIRKIFTGPKKAIRFWNEVRILRHLNEQDCPFVPRLISIDKTKFAITISYAGEPVQHLSEEKRQAVFSELEKYGVRHQDQAARNILYNHKAGEFSVIDFELAEFISSSESVCEITHRLDELDELLSCAVSSTTGC